MSTYDLKFVVQDDRDPQGFVAGAKVDIHDDWTLDVDFPQTTDTFAGAFHHALVQAKQAFTGMVKVTPLHTSGEFQGNGEAHFGVCDDANGTNYEVLQTVPIASGDTEVVFTNVTLSLNGYYVFGHTADNVRHADNHDEHSGAHDGSYIEVLKTHHDTIGDNATRTNGFAQYHFANFSATENTDSSGEAEFLALAVGDYPYYVSKVGYAGKDDTATIADQNVQEDVTLISAKARLTNIGLQVDVVEGPPLTRITNIGLQVEVGEYYSLAQPIRTRPRAAAARVLPRSPASRVGTEPPYGRA